MSRDSMAVERQGGEYPVAFESVLEKLDVALFSVSPDGNATPKNEFAARLQRGDDTNLLQIVCEEHREMVWRAIKQCTEEPLEFDTVMDDGGRRHFRAALYPQGESGQVIVVAQDVSVTSAVMEKFRERDKWQALLKEISFDLSVTPSECFDAVLMRVVERLSLAVNADMSYVFQNANVYGDFVLRSSWAFADVGNQPLSGLMDALDRHKGKLYQRVQNEDYLLVADAIRYRDDSEWVMECQNRAAIVLPLKVQGYLSGCIVMLSRLARNEWQNIPHVELITIGEIVSSALNRDVKDIALRAERDRLRGAQALAKLGYWEWDYSNGQLYWSDGVSSFFGLPSWHEDIATLEEFTKLLEPTENQKIADKIRALARFGGEVDEVVKWGRWDESALAMRRGWAKIQARCIEARIGSAGIVRGNIIDITELKNSESKAIVAHNRLEHLISTAPIVIYVYKVISGTVMKPEFFSHTVQTVFGYELDEMLSANKWKQNIHPDDITLVLDGHKKLMSTGHFLSEYRIFDKAGRVRWIYDEARVLSNTEGDAREVVGVWLDISEKVTARREIEASEARYRALVENSPALICRYGPDYSLRFVNQTFAEYFAKSVADIYATKWTDYLPPDERLLFARRLESLSPRNPTSTYEQRIVLPNGATRWQIWSDRAFFDENGVLLEVQAVGRDNTELKETQSQLSHASKMATLGAMATSLAHELNQPLNVIRIANFNAMQRTQALGEVGEFVRSKLARIDQQVTRAANIIDHMRIFGRKSHIQQTLFSPLSIVEGALLLLTEQLRAHNIVVEWNAPVTCRNVLGYPDQLEQVLINLVMNAKDAVLSKGESVTPGGERRRWIGVDLIDDISGDMLRLSVSDGGGGIPDKYLERIFEPFFTTKDVGEGTGLGLSVSFGIVRDMGGRITAENVSGGARFTVYLPAAKG